MGFVIDAAHDQSDFRKTICRAAGWCAAIVVIVTAAGADIAAQPLDKLPPKVMVATRVSEDAPDLDGRLDDAAWAAAVMVSDFLQRDPEEGKVPDEKTEVGILYDDHFLYIGARMYSDDPASLRVDVNRRDQPGNSEQIIVSLDTYRDRRTCYEFGVSAAGVRDDRYHPTDDEYRRDRSYDPVWEGRAHINDSGWTAEMRIPFSQLRFNNTVEQVWGINLNRWIPERREDNFWIYTPRDATGWSSRFGDLVGIEQIAPSRRVELIPYAASDGKFVSAINDADPFSRKSDVNGRLGADLKMGLGPNLTLDAAINPDFGQVEADPAEVNLSAFETFFSEKRPFFIEGNQLFGALGPSYFYSRRIGAPPHGGTDDSVYAKRPENTTILGAAKVTGRLQSGLSIGVLSALTAREHAQTSHLGTALRGDTLIEPANGFGVLRLQQEFGKDQSTAGIILTGVERELDDEEPLADVLRKRAYSGGADWRLRFEGGKYEISGYAGFSHVRGNRNVMLTTQKSSARYFQRPDADYVTLDSTRTSLTGYTASLRISKRSGRHWLWGSGLSAESPGFELNDLGILRSSDDIDLWGNLRYRETNPGPLFRDYNISLFSNQGWDYGGTRAYTNMELNVNATLVNYYSFWLDFSFNPRALSNSLTRGGPLMATPRGWWWGGGIGNNFSARTRYSFRVFGGNNENGDWRYTVATELSTRAGKRMSFSVEPEYQRSLNTRQYVTSRDGGSVATFGGRYIFAAIDRSTLSAQIRLNYFFTPDLSLEVYAEPFAASGHYFRFGELAAAGTDDLRVYGEAEGTTISETGNDGEYEITDAGSEFSLRQSDFGYRSFRSNVVLRWEFHRGSTLFLVWQQNRAGDEAPGHLVGLDALRRTLASEGDNFLAMKIAWWLPVS